LLHAGHVTFSAPFASRLDAKYPPNGAQRKIITKLEVEEPEREVEVVHVGLDPQLRDSAKKLLNKANSIDATLRTLNRICRIGLPDSDYEEVTGYISVLMKHQDEVTNLLRTALKDVEFENIPKIDMSALTQSMKNLHAQGSQLFEDELLRIVRSGKLQSQGDSAEVPPQAETVGGEIDVQGLTTLLIHMELNQWILYQKLVLVLLIFKQILICPLILEICWIGHTKLAHFSGVVHMLGELHFCRLSCLMTLLMPQMLLSCISD
jgi:hypothetical protein